MMTFSAQRNLPYQKADSNLNLWGVGVFLSPFLPRSSPAAKPLKPPTGSPGRGFLHTG